MKQWLFVIILLILAGVVTACSSGAIQPQPAQARPAAPAFAPQSNNEKAVAVTVTPLNLPGGGKTLDFEMSFETHSVELSFDPVAISVLRDDTGREYPALAWEGSAAGGHHRSGTLRFKVPDRATNFVEVVIRNVAGVPERVFRWNLK